MKQVDLNNEIVIYQSEDGKTQLDVKLEGETVWLNRQQLAELFDRDVKTIGKHINNALKEELNDGIPTVAKFATVQKEGTRTVNREIEYYNLDMIISVGYRVKSRRGVEFRRWANSVLKQYLIKGYAVNERIRKRQISELRQLVQVLGRTLQQQPVPTTDESNALSGRSIRPSVAWTSTPVWRRKPPCCSISLPKITPSVMEIKGSPLLCSFGS